MISEDELHALETEFNPIPSYRSLVHRLCAEVRRLRAEIARLKEDEREMADAGERDDNRIRSLKEELHHLRATLDNHLTTGHDDDEDDGR
jgi:chromosome segregation ATPase